MCASLAIIVTAGILFILVSESWQFFHQVSLKEFFTGKEWTPLFANPKYGILPLLSGTLSTTFVALLLAIPMGSVIAIFLSEFAASRVRETVKPILELLAAVPTVIYGYFALLFISPMLQKIFPDLPGFNVLSAGLVMGIMIVPYVSSLSEDALRAVPNYLREGSYAMGANRLRTALSVIYPAALSGITSSYILAISRAIGETMVVSIAAGMQPNLTWNPLEPAATITAYIVQVSMGDLPHGSLGYQTIFAAGLTLVAITFCFNILGYLLKKRYRENMR